MVHLIVEVVPISWKAPYVGSRGAFSPRHREMNLIREIIRDKYKGSILDVPINCDLIFYMPIPKSTSKKKRALMISGEIRPTGTPDRINMAKLFEDCLQEIVIKNDSKIVGGKVEKYYGEQPRIEFFIEELPIMKESKKVEKKMSKVMKEYREHDLHSGSKEGPVVKKRKQAVAIGLSEARNKGLKVPKKK